MKIPEKTILDFLARFALFGNRPAFQIGDRAITYSGLLGDIHKMIERCLDEKLRKGSIVILLMPSGYEFAICFFALTALGMVVVPLNPHIDGELIAIARLCRPSAIISPPARAAKLRRLIYQAAIGCDLIEIHGYDGSGSKRHARAISLEAKKSFSNTVGPETDACVLFTSGTSGKQKGVVLTQNGLTQSIAALDDYLRLTGEDRFLGLVPMFHGYGLTFSLLLPLWSGAHICMFELFHLVTVLSFCEEFQPTVIVGTPSIYRILAKATEGNRGYSAKTKYCLTGGSDLSPSDGLSFVRQTKLDLYNCYGSTEAGTIFIKAINESNSETSGPPMPSVKIKIIDDKAAELAKGQVGEIIVNSPWLMKRYFLETAETEQVLKNNWYHTGDLGKIDEDGNLVLYGRNNDMIKTRGYRVYPKEIERVILQHPMINDVVAFGVESAAKGEEIVAAVEYKEAEELCSQKELKKFCRQKLLDYKIPRQIFYFRQLPKLPNGKIDRSEIKRTILMTQQSVPSSMLDMPQTNISGS